MKHETPLAVRSYECDSYGHVNHAVYVNYLEFARIEFLRAHGFDYAGMVEAGYFMVVAHLEIDYRAPAYAGDELRIETEPGEIRRVSGTIRQSIRRGEDLVARAEVRWCVVDRRGLPTKPPAQYDLRGLGA